MWIVVRVFQNEAKAFGPYEDQWAAKRVARLMRVRDPAPYEVRAWAVRLNPIPMSEEEEPPVMPVKHRVKKKS